MDRTVLGGVVMAVGVAVVLVFLLAEPLGVTIGERGFGWEEMFGVIVGGETFFVGLALAFAKPRETGTPLPH